MKRDPWTGKSLTLWICICGNREWVMPEALKIKQWCKTCSQQRNREQKRMAKAREGCSVG